MKQLFRQRLTTHLKEMMRYLRLVFNDYFVLALLFVIGGLGYYYSNALKQLHTGLWWAPILIIGILLVSVQLGRFATLIEAPDYVFLLPREAELYQYLKSGFKYSLSIAVAIQVLFWILVMPFIQVTMHPMAIDLYLLLATLVILKMTWLNTDFARKYHLKRNWLSNRPLFRWLVPVITFAFSIYVNYWSGLVVSVVALAVSYFSRNQWATRSLDWTTMIADENSRMHTVYQFFNLFTDVPTLQGSVKRRRYVDVILNQIKLIPKNTYLYLYAHGIVRDNEMSGLYVRLLVIGTLFLVFVKGEILPIFLSLLFVYLIGFQMIPFYFHFSDNAFVHVYPVTNEYQLKSFQRVLLYLLTTVGVVFAVAVAAVNFTTIITIIGVIVGEALEIWAFVYLYLPRRLAKSERVR
ncbi:ABC transporter permease [Lentilactobacillus otakiensis]|uniref:ABC transporter EcsB n=1 Tax=Lentilactobacillus otakiensis DSM 19908 = JCM 15040 TaxID=1423780 RepID=S4PN42_9LACO|nr:ABC transporter permease [Lentilactobacillus otakiensis]KRL09323.1 ABC transporter EcsB [Lentilactobacillus otakiensis DSM 19908 = JCM 15040]MBZ3776624.1 ABC transporter permease [Lentilactobacillus otakiensis]MDV3517537.1 ABC transporter permease [Lentilactobacillus otakiensis]GAD15670.1 ABC transporter EcsB [Lentilactobacillus otakiensis DSM 19908 = JCM 15040]